MAHLAWYRALIAMVIARKPPGIAPMWVLPAPSRARSSAEHLNAQLPEGSRGRPWGNGWRRQDRSPAVQPVWTPTGA